MFVPGREGGGPGWVCRELSKTWPRRQGQLIKWWFWAPGLSVPGRMPGWVMRIIVWPDGGAILSCGCVRPAVLL